MNKRPNDLVATLYVFPGIGFITAALVSCVVSATVIAGAFAVKKFGGETLLRLDTLYTIHIFIVILCIENNIRSRLLVKLGPMTGLMVRRTWKSSPAKEAK